MRRLAIVDDIGLFEDKDKKPPMPVRKQSRLGIIDDIGLFSTRPEDEPRPEATQQKPPDDDIIKDLETAAQGKQPARPLSEDDRQYIPGISSQESMERWQRTGPKSVPRDMQMMTEEGQPTAERETLQQPWFDPTMAASGGLGAGAAAAKMAGSKLIPAIGRGLASAFSAAATDLPIGRLAETVEGENGEHPYLAMATAIATGVGSGMTVERAIENQLIKAFGKSIGSKAAPDVISRVKTSLAEEGPSSQWSDAISDRMIRRREDAAKRIPGQTELPMAPRSTAETTKAEGWEDTSKWDLPDFPEKRSMFTGKSSSEPARIAFMEKRMEAYQPPPVGKFMSKDNVDEISKAILAMKEGKITDSKELNRIIFKNLPSPEIDKIPSLEPVADIEGRISSYLSEYMSGKIPDSGKTGAAPGSYPFQKDPSLYDVLIDEFRKNPSKLLRSAIKDTLSENKYLNEMSGQMETLKYAGIEKYLEDQKNALRKSLSVIKGKKQTVEKPLPNPSRPTDKGGTTLSIHPSTITGPMGGLAYGIEQDEQGNYQINLRKALIGTLAGAGGPVGLKRLSRLGELYTSKVGQPVVDFVKDRTNKLITNESIRFWAGMGKDQEFKDVVRNFRRETETIWNKAKDIGLKLQEIAPTPTEQKRLVQVLKGGITSDAGMAFKARQIQEEFSSLREELKQLNLLEYSRFDKLSRAERAKLRDLTSGPDPKTVTDPKDLAAYAAKVGVDTPAVGKEELQEAIAKKVAFHKSRLDDYYHFASAEEYLPVYYDRHEGLSPKQKEIIRDEISNLKKQSRDGVPEGREAVEGLIMELEALVKSGKAGKAFKTKLVQGYAHRRQDIPIETQRMMGLIEEGAYPVAKGLGTQQTDVAKAKLFQGISRNPEWARSADDQAMRFGVPSNFKKVEGKEFGALDGMFVRKDIMDDLKDVFEWRNSFVRNWDKMLSVWKYGKVVLNPATHARNFMSNVMLSYLGDVNPGDIATYTKAGKAMVQGAKNRFYQEAADWGLFNNTFYSAEIGKLRDGIKAVRDPGQIQNLIRKAMSAPADIYQGQEKLFKMAIYIKAREGGATVDEAARKAEHFLFNYGDIPPAVKQMRRWVSPFITFTYKAVPLMAETAITKPWKLGAIMGAMYGMERFAADKLGMTPEEAKEQRESLPPWQQRRVPPAVGPYTQVLMPFKDEWGNNLYLDMAYILPYGNLGEEWGQSNLPMADVMPSLPWAKTLTAIMTNRDPFTGRDIYNKVLDSSGRILQKQLEYVWRDMMPSMAPGGYGLNKLKTGIENALRDDPEEQIQDWAGRPQSLGTAIMSSLLGIKLNPANQGKLDQVKAMEKQRMISEFQKERRSLERRKSQKRITESEYQRELTYLDDVLKRIQEGDD